MKIKTSRAYLGVCATVLLGGCQTQCSSWGQAVQIRYAHVANVNDVRFLAPVALPGKYPTNAVSAKTGGYWAIFVICSIDVSGANISSFAYNSNNLYAVYGNEEYHGNITAHGLQTYTSPVEQGPLSNGISSVLDKGPHQQPLSKGLHESLNYRIAILIPGDKPIVPDNIDFKLLYKNHPTLMQAVDGNRKNYFGYAWNASEIPSSCP